MAFVLKQHYHFWKQVVIELPGESEDAEATESLSFRGRFLLLSQARLKEIATRMEGIAEQTENVITLYDLAKEVLTGWEQMEDEDGAEIPFSAEAQKMLLDIYGAPAFVVKAFYEAMNGEQREEKVKN